MKKWWHNWVLITGILLGIIGIVCLLVIIIWILRDSSLFVWFGSIENSKASNLGQFVGGFVGVFLSGAGFLLIYSTFLEQRRFNNTISKLTDKQQFETTFFNMIDTYRKLVETMKGDVYYFGKPKTKDATEVEVESATFTGYEYFTEVLIQIRNSPKQREFLESIRDNITIPEIKKIKEDGTDIWTFHNSIYNVRLGTGWFMEHDLSKEFYVALYEFYYRENNNRLGHYFRFIYNIIKFCIEERHGHGDDKRYVDIIQAQMSNDELGLLFYNALSKYGRTGEGTQRFLNWLDYFDFFENLDSDSLLFREHHRYYSTLFKFLTKEEKESKSRTHPKSELLYQKK